MKRQLSGFFGVPVLILASYQTVPNIDTRTQSPPASELPEAPSSDVAPAESEGDNEPTLDFGLDEEPLADKPEEAPEPGAAQVEESQPNRSGIIFEETFETDLSAWDIEGGNQAADHGIILTDENQRSGSKSLRAEHRLGDPKVNLGDRAEIATKEAQLQPDGEYWIGFSTFIPADWVDEDEWLLAFQLHGFPDFDEGEDWRSPPFALELDEEGWVMTTRANADRVGGNGTTTTYRADLDKGTWTDWVFHVKFDPNGGGYLDAFKNGEIVAEHDGGIGFNDAAGPYPKLGVYRSPTSRTPSRVIYHDDFRIGDATASMEDVQPVR